MSSRRTAAAVASLFALAGCATPNSSSSGDDTETTATAPTPATNSLPDVTFDPCTDIDDSILLRFDLEPVDKKPDEMIIGRETRVACGIIGDVRAVSLVAQNTPWKQIPFDVPPQPITIHGREAWYVPGSLHDKSCSVLMRTSFGAVIINNNPAMGRKPDPSMDRCDGAVEMAEAIEPLIDDGS